MPSLPTDGELNWGDPLNTYISAVNTAQTATAASLSSHAANSPADPHGDRAYAASLVSPITTNVNGTNAYVKTNSSGVIPASLIYSPVTGGMFEAIFDAVDMYGATPNNGADQSPALQNALNACNTNGGGIVYVGPGTFAIKSPLWIGSNTWLMMHPDCVLQRITGSPNAAYILTNITTSSGGASQNITITGGTLDAYGAGVTSACTNLFIFSMGQLVVRDTQFKSPRGVSPAIELNAVVYARLENLGFGGPIGTTTFDMPAIRLNAASTTSTPAGFPSGLYTGAGCAQITIAGCYTQFQFSLTTGQYGLFSALVGNDLGTSLSGHSLITVTGCSTGYPSYSGGTASNSNAPIFENPHNQHWNTVAISGNAWWDYSPNAWAEPTLLNGFTAGPGYPPQARVTSNGYVEVIGSVVLPTTYNNVTFASLPTTAFPPLTVDTYYPIQLSGTGTLTGTPMIRLYAGGNMRFFNIPTGLASTNAFFKFEYPVEETGINVGAAQNSGMVAS